MQLIWGLYLTASSYAGRTVGREPLAIGEMPREADEYQLWEPSSWIETGIGTLGKLKALQLSHLWPRYPVKKWANPDRTPDISQAFPRLHFPGRMQERRWRSPLLPLCFRMCSPELVNIALPHTPGNKWKTQMLRAQFPLLADVCHFLPINTEYWFSVRKETQLKWHLTY